MATEDEIIGALDHRVKKLEERYPFTADELEILCRCHDHVKNEVDQDDFLMKLAQSSPYQFFFLPGDELRTRVYWIEDHILPPGFANQLRAAVDMDAFVEYANQGEEKSLERFLEGVADTGRRGSKESLRFIYRLLDQPEPEELIDICVRLAVASDVLVTPVLQKEATLQKLERMQLATESMAQSLRNACAPEGKCSSQIFVDWAETNFPMLYAPLATFVHNLLFHGHPFPKPRIPYVLPQLDRESRVLDNPSQNPSLLALSMTSTNFGGKWHCIYSSFEDGRSFNRLEYALLGYTGPTVILVKTAGQQVLGGYASEAWKDAKGEFYGSSDCFLFELDPNLKIYRSKNEADGQNYMYMHLEQDGPACHGHPHGLGFGGTLEQPRFFIPDSLEHCSAHYWDKTFNEGDLLPMESLETFEIKILEVWGVGGDAVIQKALEARAAHRERYEEMILRARTVHDKKQFATDMQSGLITNLLYAHREQARGRPDFVVDDKHGGYKIEGH